MAKKSKQLKDKNRLRVREKEAPAKAQAKVERDYNKAVATINALVNMEEHRRVNRLQKEYNKKRFFL